MFFKRFTLLLALAGFTYPAIAQAPPQVPPANGSAASQLSRFRLALAKTQAGVQDTRILFVGDSTTEGAGSKFDPRFVSYGAYPSLVKMSGSSSPPVANGMAVYNVSDGRWHLGTGWGVKGSSNGNAAGFCDGGNNAGVLAALAPAGILTFTPGATQGTYDSFTIYYITHAGNGTATVTATGGTPATINSNAADGYGKITVTARAAGTDKSVTIVPVSGAVYIAGIEPFLSTTPTVRKGNVGVSGATTAQCADTGAFGSISAIKFYAPDLTFISLGINDAASGVAAATLLSNLQTIIAAAQTSGDVILMTMPPSGDSGRYTSELSYQSVFYALSQTDGVPVVDIFRRYGGKYDASYIPDGVHPNQYGYWDWASAIDSFLNSIVWK